MSKTLGMKSRKALQDKIAVAQENADRELNFFIYVKLKNDTQWGIKYPWHVSSEPYPVDDKGYCLCLCGYCIGYGKHKHKF